MYATRPSITAIFRWFRRSTRPPRERMKLSWSVACASIARRHEARLQLLEADAARAEGVGEQAADHAALHRALERLHHARRDLVVGHDVEQQVDVRLRGIDVGHEPVEDAAIVRQHLHLVAAEDRQLAEPLGEHDGGLDLRRLRRMEDARDAPRSRSPHRARELLEGCGALEAPLGEPRPAEHQVDGESDHRLEEDEQEPPLGRLGRAPEGDDDHRHQADRPLDGDEQGPPDAGVGEPVADHFPSPATPVKTRARIGASIGPLPNFCSSAAVTFSTTCSSGIVPRSWMNVAIGVPVTSPAA